MASMEDHEAAVLRDDGVGVRTHGRRKVGAPLNILHSHVNPGMSQRWRYIIRILRETLSRASALH